MLAVKNGAKSMLRAPVKSTIFLLILAVLAALLSVSFCVYHTVQSYLRACDAYYQTVAELEYIGVDYPYSKGYDEALVRALEENDEALAALVSNEAVLRFEPAGNVLAIAEDAHRRDDGVYDPNAAVMQIRVKFWDNASEAYACYVTDTLYARNNYDEKLILLRTDEMDKDNEKSLEGGASYVVAGHFFAGESSYPWFQAEPITICLDGEEVSVPSNMRLTQDSIPEDSLYLSLRSVLEMRNSAFRVQKTANLEQLLPFQQEELQIVDGRSFTQSEYDEAADVCVISERVASILDVTTGETLKLSLYESQQNLYESLPAQKLPAQSYEIVGICSDDVDDPYWIYLPDAAAAGQPLTPVNGYRLGQFLLKNDAAEQFYEAAQALSDDGFRVSVYDQGYSVAVEPFRQLELICWIVLGVCYLLAIAILSLQSHLFVSRQRDSAQTMHALGSGKAHIYIYFLSAALLLSIPAAVLGCSIARLVEHQVQLVLKQFVTQFAAQDLRYSNSASSLSRTLTFDPQTAPAAYLAAAAATVLGSAVFALLFTGFSLRRKKPGQKKKRAAQKPPRGAKTSHLNGKLKYAVLSATRGHARTAVVLALALAVALFFGQLTGTLDSYKDQLTAVEQNTVLRGYASTRDGRLLEGVSVRNRSIESLKNTGLLGETNTTVSLAFSRYLGVCQKADGTRIDVSVPEIPQSSFAFETFIDRMLREPLLVATNSLELAPTFYYAADAGVQWLDGYGDDDLAAGEEMICVLPQTLMKQNGVELGDTVRFLVTDGLYVGAEDFKVVGSYLPPTGDGTIFTGDTYSSYYDSFIFTLKNTADLDTLRQALADAGFAQVKKGSRTQVTAVIDDQVYLSTTRSMQRQIQYVSVLYGCLYVLTGIAGVALAWLLTSSRRPELAVMRALGTQPSRIVMNFLTEQAILCAVGLLLGAAVMLLRAQGSRLLWLLMAAFFCCWCLATLACVLSAMKKQTYASLNEPE